ncbi:MAG: hypothetical protein ACRERD_17955 [Candidatus Binatia bacterium]
MELNKVILTGQARVVKGVLSNGSILSGVAQGAFGTAGDLLLTTRTIGEGEQAGQAAGALQRTGISGIIAPAFAWPFFRVCLNLGLPPLTLWEAGEIRSGDRLRVDLNGKVVKNLSSGTRYPIRDLSDLHVEILACSGMIGYLQALRAQHVSPA